MQEARIPFTERHSVKELVGRNLIIPDPISVYIDKNVDLNRLEPGVVLYPGTRLLGPKTFIGRGTQIGTEGPVMLHNAIIDRDCQIGSGFVNSAVLLPHSKLGGSTHIRPGTLIEEYASVAHSVGLKQSILMTYVTLGSLINACDVLISGGTSRRAHTEVGSGFIHFNFSPNRVQGDKATPSLIGDVVNGVFLRENRIFVGGLSGLVGPANINFGAVTIAGQIVRQTVPSNHIYGEQPRFANKPIGYTTAPKHEKMMANAKYIGQLAALAAWYSDVRLERRLKNISGMDDVNPAVLQGAIECIKDSITERIDRLADYADVPDAQLTLPVFARAAPPIDLSGEKKTLPHLDWLASLTDDEVSVGQGWLAEIAQAVEFEICVQLGLPR